MSQKCPKMSLKCPKMFQKCPKNVLKCPKMSQKCPKNVLKCPKSILFSQEIWGFLNPIPAVRALWRPVRVAWGCQRCRQPCWNVAFPMAKHMEQWTKTHICVKYVLRYIYCIYININMYWNMFETNNQELKCKCDIYIYLNMY
jgi:hypothetical protein